MRSVRILWFLLAIALLLGAANGEASEIQQTTQELRERAANLYSIGDFRAALNLYERILARDPGDAEAMDLSGWCHQRLGDRRSARDMFEKALKILEGEDAVWTLIGLGELYLNEGTFDIALSRLEEALKAAPNNAETTERASRGIELAKTALEKN